MPGAPTQGTIDLVAPFLVAAGLPSSIQTAMWSAIDAAGYTVVEKESGDPVVTIDTTPCERVQAAGLPGVYLCAAKLGTRGWLCWTEHTLGNGAVERSAPVFVDGTGELLAE